MKETAATTRQYDMDNFWSHGRPRFGFVLGQQLVPYRAYIEQWRRAEASGLEVGYLLDHFVHDDSNGRESWLDAYATLAALAASTERVRLGILVSGALLRHPAQVARSAATIDHASDGRFELGLGAGGAAGDHAFFGMPMPPLATRVAALGEALRIARAMFEQDEVAFTGRHFQVNAAVAPRPLQARLPIWVGGNHPSVVQLAGTLADGWNCYRMTPERYHDRVRILHEAASAAGRDVRDVRLSVVVKLVFARSRPDRDRRIAELVARSGMLADQVAAEVIVGGPADWIQALSLLHELGAHEFAIDLDADEPMVNAELLERVASDVVPAFGQTIRNDPTP